MKRIHAFLIALALGIAVVAGTFAALRTQQLSRNATPSLNPNQYLRQTRVLNRAEASLRAELRKRPPAIPPIPRAAGSPVAVSTPAGATAPVVVYTRPAPIVRVIHRHGGEHEDTSADGTGGGGLDD